MPSHSDSDTAAAFRAEDLWFDYPDGSQALEAVNLAIAPGERVALLGANGSGKSTLLRLLGGLAFSSRGRVEAFGQELTEAALACDETAHSLRRRVQFVFQDADIQLFMPTVAEDVMFGPMLLLRDDAKAREQAHEALKALGIGHLSGRAPHRLSGGEKRKAALATALAIRPDALLLDEPAAGLDPRSAGGLIDILDGYHDGGGTIVLATHDLPLLAELADRAVVLGSDHRIHADASVADILADRALLEAHNLVHVHRHRHGDHAHAHPHEHGLDGPGHRHTG